MEPKYPEVEVTLVGNDGNAFVILGNVTKEMCRAGIEKEERDAFIAEATAGDYDRLLQTCVKWVKVR